MAQRDESKIKDVVRCNAADGHAHSISCIAIETWLWPIIFASHNDWPFRGRMKFQLLRRGRERRESSANIINRCGPFQLHANRSQVAVADVDAIALCAYFDSCFLNGIAVDVAEQLQSLRFDLLFLAA